MQRIWNFNWAFPRRTVKEFRVAWNFSHFLYLRLLTQKPFSKSGDNYCLGGGRMSEFNEHLLFDPGVTQCTDENLVLFVLLMIAASVCSPPSIFFFFFTCLLTFFFSLETFLGISKHNYHSNFFFQNIEGN